jgi:hypothetical protein
MNSIRAAVLVSFAAASAAGAQSITLGPLPCLPNGENGVVTARIDPAPAAEIEVRLYFRRQSLMVEDFYYTVMVPTGGGNYWGIFPQPENSKFPEKKIRNPKKSENAWAEWWRTKEGSDDRDPNPDLDKDVIVERASLGMREKRDWMVALDDDGLQSFLRKQTTEPAEYFVALFDPAGTRLAKTPQQVVDVRDDCRAALTPHQAGYAMNLTVGETSRWQANEPVFHWECTGIVTRIDPQRVLRADEACRACVVAWWPVAAGAGALGAIVSIVDDDPGGPGEVSPSRP